MKRYSPSDNVTCNKIRIFIWYKCSQRTHMPLQTLWLWFGLQILLLKKTSNLYAFRRCLVSCHFPDVELCIQCVSRQLEYSQQFCVEVVDEPDEETIIIWFSYEKGDDLNLTKHHIALQSTVSIFSHSYCKCNIVIITPNTLTGSQTDHMHVFIPQIHTHFFHQSLLADQPAASTPAAR